MQNSSFKKSFSWALVGQFANVVTQFLIITSIARIGSVTDVGLYGLIAAIVSPLQLFFLMDIGKLIITDSDFNSNLSHFHSSFIINCALIPIISCIIVAIIYHDTNTLLSALSISTYWSLINYREYYYSIYQRMQRLDFQGKSSLLYAVVSVLVFVAVMYFTKKPYIAFFVLSIAYTAILVLYETRKVKQICNVDLRISFNWQKQKVIFTKGVSLGTTAFLTSIKANVPRYIIEYFFKNREMLGYYTLYIQCINVIGSINITAAKSMMGRFSSIFHTDKTKFLAMLIRACCISLIGGILLWLLFLVIGKQAINIVFGAKYSSAIFILSWLMISRIFVLPSTYLKITQVLLSQIHSQLIIMLLSILVILACYFGFLSSYNIYGLLYALVISDIFVLVLTSIMVYNGATKALRANVIA